MAGGYSAYLKGFIENGGLQDTQQFLDLLGNLNLPGPLQEQIDAANAAITGEMVCGPVCAGIAGGIVEAINLAGHLVDIFSGVPRTQKTIQTAQRLMQSSVIPIQVLGQWWNKAGGANIIDSNAPDITRYFKPAFDFTIQTLNIPFAAPDWYALSQVIGEGAPASRFDQSYAAQNRAPPMFVTSEAFKIQHPDDRYPDELVKVYQLVAHDFVQHITPQPGVPPPPVTPGPQGGGDQGGGGGQVLDIGNCCQQIVTALNSIGNQVGELDNVLRNGSLPQLVIVGNGILNNLAVITQSISALLSSTGVDLSGLAQSLQSVGSELINTLQKIDVDADNSLAGVANAIANLKPVDLSKIEEELKCLCGPPLDTRVFIRALVDQDLLDTDISSRVLAALPQSVA